MIHLEPVKELQETSVSKSFTECHFVPINLFFTMYKTTLILSTISTSTGSQKSKVYSQKGTKTLSPLYYMHPLSTTQQQTIKKMHLPITTLLLALSASTLATPASQTSSTPFSKRTWGPYGSAAGFSTPDCKGTPTSKSVRDNGTGSCVALNAVKGQYIGVHWESSKRLYLFKDPACEDLVSAAEPYLARGNGMDVCRLSDFGIDVAAVVFSGEDTH